VCTVIYTMLFEACGKGVFSSGKLRFSRKIGGEGGAWCVLAIQVGLDVYAEGFGEFFDFCEFEDEVSAFVCEFVDCFTVFFFFLD